VVKWRSSGGSHWAVMSNFVPYAPFPFHLLDRITSLLDRSVSTYKCRRRDPEIILYIYHSSSAIYVCCVSTELVLSLTTSTSQSFHNIQILLCLEFGPVRWDSALSDVLNLRLWNLCTLSSVPSPFSPDYTTL
jgi:hypothetical protein